MPFIGTRTLAVCPWGHMGAYSHARALSSVHDLARLKAIIEADHYFSQLREVNCPLCGASIQDHDAQVHHSDESGELQNLRMACKEEARKIQSLLRDLLGASTQLDTELSSLEKEQVQHLSLFQEVSKIIEQELAPRAKQLQGELTEFMEHRDALAYVEMLQERLLSLRRERDDLAKAVWHSQAIENDGRQDRRQSKGSLWPCRRF